MEAARRPDGREAGGRPQTAPASRGRALIASGLALAAALAVPAPHAHALDPLRAPTQYRHHVWQGEEGLPQSAVQAITQTRDGYLWIGTQEGVARFDGVRFVVFDRRTTPEIRHNSIRCLLEDRAGNLWIGTNGGGLTRYRSGSFRSFGGAEGLPSDRVFSLLEGRDGTVWVGTNGGGLARWDGRAFRVFTARDGLADDAVMALAEDSDGRLWAGTRGGGLSLVEREAPSGEVRFRTLSARDGLPGDRILALAADPAGGLWVGTEGAGLLRLTVRHGSAGTASFDVSAVRGLPSEQVFALRLDRDGNLWIGTRGAGLVRLRAGALAAFSTRDGLTSDHVYALFEDREGSLFVGTIGGGLNRLADGKVTPFTVREGLSSDMAYVVCQGPDESLFVGTDGGGLNQLTAGGVRILTARDGLPNDRIFSLLPSLDGSLLIGTFGGGLARLSGRRLSVHGKAEGLSTPFVYSLAEDPDGTIWIGTSGGGLFRMEGKAIEPVSPDGGLPHRNVRALLVRRAGGLWAGTDAGLSLLTRAGERLVARTFRAADGLPGEQVFALHEDAAGVLWAGTNGGGLARVEVLPGGGARIESFSRRQGLYDDTVFAILEDDDGGLWLTSNRGVARVRKADLEAVGKRRSAAVTPLVLGIADGMRSAECNGSMQPAGWRLRDGRLAFPTVRGIALVDPRRLATNALPPPVHVEEVLADGRPVTDGAEIGPGVEKLEVRYAALSFLAPERVLFEVQLEGLERTFVDAGTRRTAYYTNLGPGRYSFRVKACNNDGVWNDTAPPFRFRVRPFFHQTPWFAAGVVLGAIGLVAVGFRLRLRQLRRRAADLSRLVEERTAELRSSNERLRQAEGQIARLSASHGERLENTSAWARSMAEEVGAVLGARAIGVWEVVDSGLAPLVPSTRPPRLPEPLSAVGTGPSFEGDVAQLPVLGLTGELRGVVVAEGASHLWGDVERNLLQSFAHHLGTALDMGRLRQKLTAAEVRRAANREELRRRGVPTAASCPRCASCFDDAMPRCPECGATPDTTRLLPLAVGGRYTLTRLLGEGGMGTVYRARDQRLGREVAVKVIRAEQLHAPATRFRLEREARVMARMRHPGIVDLFDAGELEDGSAFLVMELLEGTELSRVLAAFGPGRPSQVAALLRQATSALCAAHREGIIHRDVKPANIFLCPVPGGFRVKLLDFGLAKATRAETQLTVSGMVVGTPAYMSPEQVRGLEVDPRSDLYSLALVAFEALTGQRVVAEASKPMSVMLEVLTHAPPRLSELLPAAPQALDAALTSALEKSREERPSDLEAWAAAVARLLDELVVPGRPGWPADRLDARLPAPAADPTRPVAP